MALETGTYVSDLVATNPTSGDPVAQGDDHIRLIKAALQSTFPDASAPIYGFRAKTATAATSGTSIDFTSIPSWAKRISVVWSGLSTSGTSVPIVQLGDSGGVEASGYVGSISGSANLVSPAAANFGAGFALTTSNSTSSVMHGSVVLTLVDSATNTWVACVSNGFSDLVFAIAGSGSKALSATLDRVRLTTTNGTDTFDAGTVNVLYE